MENPSKSLSRSAIVLRAGLVMAIGVALSYGIPIALSDIGAGAWAKATLGAHGFYEIYIAAGFAGVLIAAMAMQRMGPLRALEALGIANIAPLGCVLALAAMAAAIATLLYARARYQAADGAELLLFGIVGPFVEEVFFRGFLFRQMRKWAGAPFIVAALLSSLLFGAGHFDQGSSLADSLMNAGVTFLGGVLLSWLVERWGSIWPGFIVHAGLNVVWTVFALGDNAVGGSAGNIARLATVVIVLAGTAMLARSERPA
ncbi:MAG TPA: CPBP family intramembrane glutamic endopeptidase [Rhizomicrobium sp.]|jgi:membrane protease YdiL (CAAX protease family)|nr:CPBP family intramembrane glutamic endopeptidase [Rhizomicrobium sp.]